MSVVICNREGCRFRDAGRCCTKDYITLYSPGICSEWFNNRGEQRVVPLSAELADIKPDEPKEEEAIPASEKEE